MEDAHQEAPLGLDLTEIVWAAAGPVAMCTYVDVMMGAVENLLDQGVRLRWSSVEFDLSDPHSSSLGTT